MGKQEITSAENIYKVWLVIKHPMVWIPLLIGIGSLCFISKTNTEYQNSFLTAVSTIAFGIGVNYFSFFFKDWSQHTKLTLDLKDMESEKKVFVEKSKSAVNRLKNLSRYILDHANDENRALNSFDLHLIREIASIQEGFGDYHSASYQSEIHQFTNEAKVVDRNDENVGKIKLNNTSLYLTSHNISVPTGSFDFNAAAEKLYSPNTEPNRFGGSGSNEQVFKQDS